MEHSILLAALAITAINMPFGAWRARAKEAGRRLEWLAAIHAPVPLAVLVRWAAGIELSLQSIAVLLAAFSAGQLIGAKIYGVLRGGARGGVS